MFGKTLFSKIANGTVLIVLLIYAASKTGLIEPSVTRGLEYSIPAHELSVSSAEELQKKLSGFIINEEELTSELAKAGVDLANFQENTSMEMIISITHNGFEGLVIEFQSTISPDQLNGAYSNIVNQVRNHVSGKKG